MRKEILIAVVILPLLAVFSQAGQSWTVNSWPLYGIPSEDSEASSAYLGVDIADVTADRVSTLKLKEEQGVEVTMVDQDAPAGKAGIKEHDVIVTMNGTSVESKTQLQRMIHETPAGRVVILGLSRDGQPMTVKVQLGDRRSEFPHMAKGKDYDFHFEMPEMPDIEVPNIGVVYVHSSVRGGLAVENLTPQLGDFFGAKDGRGVLVRSVERGSRAEKAGLRAGDVIVKVGEQAVHDTSDFTHALHVRSSGSVNVEVIRDRKTQTLTISLPGRKESGDMFEESFDTPNMDAQNRMELTEVHSEIARLQPQMELAIEQGRKAAEEMRQSLCDQQKQMREQAAKIRKEYSSQVQELRKKRDEMRKSRDQMRKQMEQFRREMQSHWMDI